LPGLAAVVIQGLGGFEVVGLADAIWGVLHEGAVHGLGSGEDAELALVVGAVRLPAEVDGGSVDLALFGDGFAAAEREAGHGRSAS